jgi:hypothetical protein
MQKHFLVVSSFEHVNFVINEKYYKKNYDNPNYYASFMIFQTCKNVILRNVHSFGWLLWLWFYPYVVFHFLFGTYGNERWIHHFKMTKCTFFDIAHQVKPLVGKQNIKYQLAIPIEIWVAYTIYKLAQGVNNLMCSELFAFGQFTIFLVIHEVILMINVVFKNLNY